MLSTLYWVLEFAKVAICYLFVLFIWPSVIFRKYLRGKSNTFRFCFCVTTQIVIINTSVLGLGLLFLLNSWAVNILFYGSLIVSLRKHLIPTPALRANLSKLLSGTFSLRGFALRYWSSFTLWLRKQFRNLWQHIRPHFLEFALLTAIVAYGIIYFSYAPIFNHSYGFGDMYTHHAWIYGLIQGQIFSGGVYPEAMHCVVYLMHTVTGLSTYSCNLFLGCIHISVYILAAYCLMREIFRWRGTPLIVLTAFLVAAVNSSDLVVSMSRLQRTLPGEYGLYTVFICALFLLRFLKENIEKGWDKNPREWLKSENLLVFCMSLAASISIHFYVTIIAFFVCLAVAVIYFVRALSLRRLLPLAAAVICGVSIAVLPMGGALLTGIPFQGSINWAMDIMSGEKTEANLPDPGQTPDSGTEDTPGIGDTPAGEEPGVVSPGPGQSPAETEEPTLVERVSAAAEKYVNYLYIFGYQYLVGESKGTLAAYASLLIVAFWLVFRLVCALIRPLRGAAGIFDNYLPAILASVFLLILYAAPYIGLPELISYNRVPSTAYLFLLMVAAMPVDILFCALRFTPNWLQKSAPVACVAVVCLAVLLTGNYHGYFYNELTRYRSEVDVTNSIVQSFPENTYTIVSSTDEVYSVIQYGRHEELLDFLKRAGREPGYYLPTEYVFIYVEKQSIEHAQYHYSSGPSWLATDTYADNNVLNMRASKYPEIFASEVTDDYEVWSVDVYPTAYSSYSNVYIRTIVNAKARKWCREFGELYSHELKVYYEDDYFVCYYFRQNTYSLYDLAIWAQSTQDSSDSSEI